MSFPSQTRRKSHPKTKKVSFNLFSKVQELTPDLGILSVSHILILRVYNCWGIFPPKKSTKYIRKRSKNSEWLHELRLALKLDSYSIYSATFTIINCSLECLQKLLTCHCRQTTTSHLYNTRMLGTCLCLSQVVQWIPFLFKYVWGLLSMLDILLLLCLVKLGIFTNFSPDL